VRGVIDNNATLISATFDDVDARTEQRIDVLSTEFTQNALTLTHDFSDTLRFRFRQVGVSCLSRSRLLLLSSPNGVDWSGYR
jgi:hypothetical protein